MSRPPGLSFRAMAAGFAAAAVLLVACDAVDRLFMRHSPQVDKAIAALDAGQDEEAAKLLQNYLATGQCEDGQIGAPPTIHDKPSATFDLGLALFELAETYGQRFGEPDPPPGAKAKESEQQLLARSGKVDCALRLLRAVAADLDQPRELRARAHYLAGNLEFLRREYATAVTEYDQALRLIPGMPADAGVDTIGVDAAWNRAIALERQRDKERDAGQPDAGQPDAGQPDAGQPDAGQPDAGQPDAGQGDAGPPDAGSPDGGQQDQQQGEPDAGAPDAGQGEKDDEPPPRPQPRSRLEDQPIRRGDTQDDRVLDMLERADPLPPRRSRRPVPGTMEDK